MDVNNVRVSRASDDTTANTGKSCGQQLRSKRKIEKPFDVFSLTKEK